MPTTRNYLSAENSLVRFPSGTSINQTPEYLNNGTTPRYTWSSANASISVVSNIVKLPSCNSLLISPFSESDVFITLNNVPIDGNVKTLRDRIRYGFHCLLLSNESTSYIASVSSPFGSEIPSTGNTIGGQFGTIRSNLLILDSRENLPSESYLGADTKANISLQISNHLGNPFYITFPVLIDVDAWKYNSFVSTISRYVPTMYKDIDEIQDPEFPFFKLIDVLTYRAGEAAQIQSDWFRFEPDEFPLDALETDQWTRSQLTDAFIASEETLRWAAQVAGSKLYREIYAIDPDTSESRGWQNQTYPLEMTTKISANAAAYDNYSISEDLIVVPKWAPVKTATTDPIDISTGLVNGATIGGVVVATGDRVLVRHQSNPVENGIYTVVASGAASRSDDADSSYTSWTTQVSNFGTTDINSVAYGNSLWIAAGDAGQIRTSTDAVTWVTQTSNFGSNIIYSVAYGNSLWVAAGSTGQIRTSDDTLSWVTRTSNFGTTDIQSVAYGNGLWVAAGDNGQIRTSIDGITWTTQVSNFGTTNVYSVAYGNGLWVAAGWEGQLRSSTDAVTWVTQTSNFGTSIIWSVAYGNNLWVAGGWAGQIRTSTDAVTWVTQTSNFGGNIISSLAYGDGLWVAGSSDGQIRVSSDAVTWVTVVSNFGTSAIESITYANELFVASGEGGALNTSNNEFIDDEYTQSKAVYIESGIFAGSYWKLIAPNPLILDYMQIFFEETLSPGIIDGVDISDGYNILLLNQTNPAENGVYTIDQVTGASRHVDMDQTSDFFDGLYIEVSSGSRFGNTLWRLFAERSISVDVDPVLIFYVDKYLDFLRSQVGTAMYGHAAGSIGAIKNTAKQFLSGSRRVIVDSNLPSQYYITVKTIIDETPGVDAVDMWDSCLVATVENITISTDLVVGAVLDGIVLSKGNRVLVKDQTTPSENGIYAIQETGGAIRATDADNVAEFTTNKSVLVSNGLVNSNTYFTVIDIPVTIDVSDITFAISTNLGSSDAVLQSLELTRPLGYSFIHETLHRFSFTLDSRSLGKLDNGTLA